MICLLSHSHLASLFSHKLDLCFSGQLQPVFNDTQCFRFGVFEVADNQKMSLTVTGLGHDWNIYWSVSGPSTNGTEIRLGNCETCNRNCSSTNCTELGDERFHISRPESQATTLRFVGDVESIDGSTVKCAQFNNNSIATCSISVLKDYTLSHCEQDELEVTDSEPWTAITCHNLKDHHNISWIITDPNNHSTEVATCQACTDCSNACRTNTDDVTVSRTGSVSELRIVGKVMEKDNSKLTCGREDGSLQASCRIRVTSAGHANSDKSSTTAVAGGVVAGVLLLLLVVVAVVVIVKRRNLRNIFTRMGLAKRKQGNNPQLQQNENTSASNYNHESTKPSKSARRKSSSKRTVADAQENSHLKVCQDARAERNATRDDEQTTGHTGRIVTDTYAKVNKQAKGNNLNTDREKPGSEVQSTDITVADTGSGMTRPDGAMYARVNKNKKTPDDQGNSAAEYTDCSSQLKDENPAAHAYVNMSGVPEGDVTAGTYTTGTNLTGRFESDRQDVTKTAECDDDYNTLHQTTHETRNHSTYDRIVQPM
ncbi:uncharacterized protein [Littorina saxatilis]|uniref:uncharacterized protein n=1 Tax=Littorina saxatilis TaxID=31220 RepID=UPI0038B5FD79